jgi:GDP-L-fucose synthase
MKIFVTGSNGFLGSHLIPKLRTKGYDLLTPRSYEVDLMNYQQVENYIRRAKPDTVIHLAAHYGGLGINVEEPENLFFYNTIMATNLFDAAARNGVKKIIPIGSSCSYPALLEDLKEEDFWSGRCHDSVEAYGFSKKLQVVGLTAYRKAFGIDFCHLVLTNMYGERDDFSSYRGHAISVLIKKFADAVFYGHKEVICWGDGSPQREFVYAGDAAEAIARYVEAPHDPDPINVGTGVAISIKELVDLIIKHTGFDGDVVWDASKPNGIQRKVMDVSKLGEKLNWLPEVNIDDGIKRTVKWYNQVLLGT